MLKNFLEALEITGAAKKLKRVILTAGAKQYGVHLGQPKNPMEESDPWIDGPGRPPNFYYRQQNKIKRESQKSSWDCVVTYPNDVIGVAKGNFMNLATSVGIYASISKPCSFPVVKSSTRILTALPIPAFTPLSISGQPKSPNAAIRPSTSSMAILSSGRKCGRSWPAASGAKSQPTNSKLTLARMPEAQCHLPRSRQLLELRQRWAWRVDSGKGRWSRGSI